MSASITNSEKVLVPALRFREFDEVWDKMKLSDVCLKIQDGNYGGSYPKSEEFVKEGIPFLTSKALGGDGILKENKIDFLPLEKHQELKKAHLKLNDVLFTNRGSNVGSIGFTDERIAHGNIGPQLTLLRSDLNIIRPHFLFQIMASNIIKKQVSSQDSGSAMNFFGIGATSKFKFTLPSLPEQQKIASFLSAVDDKVQQLTKKKALLEDYKKGVMQQLFSGQLRFKDEDGKDYPEWEWVGGNVLFDNISDKKHNSDLPILAITQDQGAIPRELINYQMTVTEASVASYKVVQKGDFIISLRTFQGGIEFSDYHGICSPAYNILRPSSDDVDRAFYKFYLKTSFYIRQLQKNLEGIRDGKMISYKYFSEIKIPFPSHPEQQKIATYLSGTDTKIESVNTQITQTQTFKKGLLQQMFV
jgi:type I restriction enzyme S subunit